MTSILGAVFFTLLFLTGNTMMQSVRERIPELAVLKTLGFTDLAVVILILSRGAGPVPGRGAPRPCHRGGIFPAMKDFIGVAKLPTNVVTLGSGVAVLLALVTGLPPAWRTTRLNIIDALAGR